MHKTHHFEIKNMQKFSAPRSSRYTAIKLNVAALTERLHRCGCPIC